MQLGQRPIIEARTVTRCQEDDLVPDKLYIEPVIVLTATGTTRDGQRDKSSK